MIHTYRALLHGDRLEWLEEAPESQVKVPLKVHVTVLEQEPSVEANERGQDMAAILEKLAQHSAFSEITDPVNWQRELRQDRELPTHPLFLL